MKKVLILVCSFIFFISLSSCNKNIDNYISNNSFSRKGESMSVLELKIDDNILDVVWENNNSVDELKDLASGGLIINMHEYGGFEQTGFIGKSIVSNDKSIDVIPGDIVLYNSNQISIFYENSRWSYTKLGHINLNKDEMNNLINKDSIVLSIRLN